MLASHNIIYSFPSCLASLCICSPLWHSLLVSHRQTINCLAPLKKKKRQEKSKQRNSFVNSLLLLAADLAQVVMPILLELAQTSYCHPSLAGAPRTQMFVRVCVLCAHFHIWMCVHIYARVLSSMFVYAWLFVYVCEHVSICVGFHREHFVITCVPDWWHCHYV